MKNLLIGTLAVACVLLAVFAFVQRSEAQNLRLEVVENAARALEAEQQAMQQRKFAESAMVEAKKQLQETLQMLAQCAKKK
jgi:hypothetical protein